MGMPEKTKRIVGYEQEYHGATRWPIYEIWCPDCQQWRSDYGDCDTLVGNTWYPICKECAKSVEETA